MTPVANSITHVDRGKTAGTLPGFRLMGVPVRLHFTFILFVLFLLVTFLGGARGGSNYAIFLAGAVLSVLLHEMGHAAMAAHFGYRTVEVVMFPIGGLSRMERPLKPAAEAWVSAAGPVVNLILAGGIFGYLMLMHQQPGTIDLKDMLSPSDSSAAALLLYGNVLFAIFNLLPAFPMDGGRLLRALLSYVRPPDEATRVAAWMGRMLAMGMGLYGLVDQQFLLVFFALFIYLGAAQEGVAAFGRTLTQGIPARAAMITDFHTLEHGNTVRDAANLLLSTSQQDFPVMHNGAVVGMLDRNLLLRAIANDGPEAYVAGVMDREFMELTPNEDLAELLPVMARAGRCALVIDQGKLLGLLTTENLSEFLLLRRFGMEPVL